MNSKELLCAFGSISHKYYDEAENETLPTSRITLRRPLLIAALIALMAVLVGCTVVYVLRLQDMSIGKETYTQYFNEEGLAIDPTEKERDILTLFGHNGDKIQLALTEWYNFLEAYDPNGEYMTNEPDNPDIPNRYEHTYYCYTQDMVNKLDTIVQKYQLELLEEPVVFQRYQSHIFLAETGIHSLLLSDAEAQIQSMAGMLYPPYNFNMEFELVMDRFNKHLSATIAYTRKNYMPTILPGGMDLTNFTQWDHTTSNGTQLLLALNNKGVGYVIAESDEAMMVLSVKGNLGNTLYPDSSQIISVTDLEAIADVFDYSISPKKINTESTRKQLDEAEAAYRAEHAYVPETYRGFNDYLMRNMIRERDNLLYTFYDLTGDGANELLLGIDGWFDVWITIQDGQAISRVTDSAYLCEGRVLEAYRGNWKYEDFEEHRYNESLSDTAVLDVYPDPESIGSLTGEWIGTIRYTKGQWYKFKDPANIFDLQPITEEEANGLISQYPRLELDWKPLMEYPLDGEGTTLGSYLRAKDVRVSDEELYEIYIDYLQSIKEMYYTHYRIMDFNGDGVKDLLLSGDGEIYWNVLSYRYGTVMNIYTADFVLCEDGIADHCGRRIEYPGIEIQEHEFIRLNGFEEEQMDFVAYNKSTASWECDRDGTPMDAAEAEAILSRYPRIDQGMRPIEELLG